MVTRKAYILADEMAAKMGQELVHKSVVRLVGYEAKYLDNGKVVVMADMMASRKE